eukprot:scaffold3581_cov252-Pinguiococcus_pyrenoidosus.AAC.13
MQIPSIFSRLKLHNINVRRLPKVQEVRDIGKVGDENMGGTTLQAPLGNQCWTLTYLRIPSVTSTM